MDCRTPLDKNDWSVQFAGMTRRVLIAIAIGAFLVLEVVGILGFAHGVAYSYPGKCFFSGFLHAQWPKWIGCAMTTHENLAGGLIGGAGALFAAFIAADAVWHQLAFERQKFNLAEERRNALEIYSFERVIEYYSRLLRPFDLAVGHEDGKHVNGIDDLYKTGNLVPFFGSLPADHQSLARDAWERLSNLNHALIELRKQPGVPDVKSRMAINAGIGEVVESMGKFRQLAEQGLAQRAA
jgi:hypothetical protein